MKIPPLDPPVVTDVISLSPSAHNRIIMSRCVGRVIWPVIGLMAVVALAAWWKNEINWYFLIPIVGLIMLPSLMLAAFMTQTLSREAAESVRPHRFEFCNTLIRVIPIKEKNSGARDSGATEERGDITREKDVNPDSAEEVDERKSPEFPDNRSTYAIPVTEVADMELTGEYLLVKLQGSMSRFILVPHQSLSRDESRRLVAFMRALTAKPDVGETDW